MSPDERALDSTLRQLSQFGYDLDRLQYVAQDEVELLAEVRQDYDRFIGIVTRAVELARAGQVTEARQVQLSEAGPLADRLERLTNQLVNVAEADMLERIEASQRAYDISRTVVVAFALGSIVLALGLGYVFSWSLVGPLTEIEARLRQIAAGDFTERVRVVNRDELGALAANVNRTMRGAGRLYRRSRSPQLQRSVGELGDARRGQPGDQLTRSSCKRPASIAAHAATLAEADAGIVYAFDEPPRSFRLQATHELDPEVVEALTRKPMRLGQGAIGRAGLRRAAGADRRHRSASRATPLRPIMLQPGYRALLAVPLLREDSLVGGLVLCRKTPGAFAAETVELVQTLANQSVLAIQNAELFEELERKGRELAAASRHKSEFLANMSHELRTPLNACSAIAELIQDGIYGEVPAKITGDARADPGERPPSARPDQRRARPVQDRGRAADARRQPTTRCASWCWMWSSATEALAAEKQLAFEVEVPRTCRVARGDERRLTQVLMNLVSNAIKFTEAGSVRIRAKVEDGSFLVAVSDTGVGIARRGPRAHLRGVPAGRHLQHAQEGRHRPWPCDRTAHRRAAWRPRSGSSRPRARARPSPSCCRCGSASGRKQHDQALSFSRSEMMSSNRVYPISTSGREKNTAFSRRRLLKAGGAAALAAGAAPASSFRGAPEPSRRR